MNKYFQFLALVIVFSSYLTFSFTFLFAFFNHGEVSILVNSFHEAWFEFFILVLSAPFVIWYFFKLVIGLAERFKK